MTVSILQSDLNITGDIRSEGTVDIRCQIKGNVYVQSVSIAADARVEGNVTARKVEVTGKLQGNVQTDSLTLVKTAEVIGDISCAELSVEKGAAIQGKLDVGGARRAATATTTAPNAAAPGAAMPRPATPAPQPPAPPVPPRN
jgi:cytoskeletal protein CcmA (bactofilin family)